MTPTLHLILLAAAWVAYGVLHSVLASTSAKRWFEIRFPRYFRGYRLGFNLLAAVLLLPPVWLLFSYPGQPLWRWPAAVNGLPDALALLALAGFVWSTRYYDTAEFLGTRQLRGSSTTPADRALLSLSPLHRWVRHPWYFLGLVILWTRPMDAAMLTSAIVLTGYVVIGARLEDAKLVEYYGEAYRHYRKQVPGLIPRPWRHLSSAAAEDILKRSA